MTLKQLQLIGKLLAAQALVLVPLGLSLAYRAAQTEHARMNDKYIAPLWEKLLEVLFSILMGPAILVSKVFPSGWMFPLSQNPLLLLALNALLTGSLLLGLFWIFSTSKFNQSRLRRKRALDT